MSVAMGRFVSVLGLLGIFLFSAKSMSNEPQAEGKPTKIKALIEVDGEEYVVDIDGTIRIQTTSDSSSNADDDVPPPSGDSDSYQGGDPGGGDSDEGDYVHIWENFAIFRKQDFGFDEAELDRILKGDK